IISMKSTEKIETEFPRGIGRPARSALIGSGYTRYDQLTAITANDLLRLHGVGPKAVRILEAELASRGLSFATATPRKPEVAGSTSQDRD
ncbi:hypothetical protein AB4144_32760, partial [Rhizobiaceae sp. 2RAB30]